MMDYPRRESGRTAEAWFGQFWKMLVRLALIAFAGYFVWRVRTILTDILVASILAFALIGPVNALCRYRLPKIRPRTQRLFATLLVFIALGYLLFVGGSLMVSPFVDQMHGLASNLPVYQHKIAQYAAVLSAEYNSLPPDLKALLHRPSNGGGSTEGFAPLPWLQTALLATATGIARIVDVILIPVLAFYFVLDGAAPPGQRNAGVAARLIKHHADLCDRPALALRHRRSRRLPRLVPDPYALCARAGPAGGRHPRDPDYRTDPRRHPDCVISAGFARGERA